MPPAKVKDTLIGARVSFKEAEKLHAAARDQNITLSQLLRAAVAEYLAKRRKPISTLDQVL